MSERGSLGLVVALALLVGYAVVSHVLIVGDDRSQAAYAFSLCSAALMVCALAWSSRWRWLVVSGVAVLVVLGWMLRARIGWEPRWLYLLQHAGAHAALAFVFGRTLARGQRSLITRIALAVQGPLPPDMIAYTRSVTLAWTACFAITALVSIVLFASAPAWIWSVLANFVTPPLIGAMFLGEYLVRRRLFPDHPHATLMDGIRAFSRPR